MIGFIKKRIGGAGRGKDGGIEDEKERGKNHGHEQQCGEGVEGGGRGYRGINGDRHLTWVY